MATDYLNSLIDELDPEQQKPKGPLDLGAMSGTGGVAGERTPGSTPGVFPESKPTGATVGPADAPASNPYRDGSTVNLPGWDNTRTDNAGKYEFGRFAQSKGGHITGDDVRAFVAANPDEWEIFDPTGKGMGNDPLIRQKQSWMDDPTHGDPKRGQRSVWQDVIGDSGPGGANRAQFGNAAGDPALGFAEPDAQAAMGGGGGINPLLMTGDPTGNINAALGQYGGQSDLLQRLIQQLQGTAA